MKKLAQELVMISYGLLLTKAAVGDKKLARNVAVLKAAR